MLTLDVSAILLGLLVGGIVGLSSTGGGALLTPALMLYLDVPPAMAVGSGVLAACGLKLLGGVAYAIQEDVHWTTVGRLATGSVPGAFVGVALLGWMPEPLLQPVLYRGVGILLALTGTATLVRMTLATRLPHPRMPSLSLTVFLGFVTGVLVSLTSVGSGSLLLCFLTVFFPLSARTVVGTDLAHALILSAIAALGHTAAGRVDTTLAAAIVFGGVPGVLLGARIATAVPDEVLRVGLATLLIGIGLQLVTADIAPPVTTSPVRLEGRP